MPTCRFCQATLSHTLIDLGMSPLCESYLSRDQLNQMEPFYPLHVYVCARCFLVQVEQYGLSPSFYNTLLQQVAAVSPAQVKALLKNELNPNNEVVVVLADKAHLDKTFADAGITDVKIVEPEYK